MAIEELSNSLPMMLYKALDTIMPKFRIIFKEFGITEPQARVLRILWQHKKIALNELSSLSLITPPSLVGVIDRMELNGFVERNNSNIDRRKIIVNLTKKGKTLESKILPKVEKVYTEIESSMTKKDLNNTLFLLNKISLIDKR
ncbi:MarR family transcriptional regulator [Woeseiaceae bacterium]|jgi:MarR family transcriptional regulator, organic hydroperoxide resistance regulator|nr:MarR family transcriptional regulator [Woeseiaceae bacterium]MDB2544239.1 MarR family transcriptional regulator [Woeseiaceae bacterium]